MVCMHDASSRGASNRVQLRCCQAGLSPCMRTVQVGVVSGGLAAVAWSPDGELVVAASRVGQLLMMTKVRKAG